MSDWKEENIEMRKSIVESEIRRIRDDDEKNESVIRKIDNENMAIFGKSSGVVFKEGLRIPTRGFYMTAGVDIVHVDVGARNINRDDEIVYARINGGGDELKSTVEDKDKVETLTIIMKGELALDKAIATYEGIALYLKGFKDEYLKRCAETEKRESESEV